MRGVVVYVRYVIFPANVFITIVWVVHIIGRIAKKVSDKRDTRDRRKT